MGNQGNLDRLQSVAGGLAKAPIRLVVVSSASVAAPGLEVELRTHPWTPETERADLASFDAGILPMFDDAVDRGKSPLKLLQYAAAGLPILASPVAIDRSLWIHGKNILFASTPEEWTAHAAALASDPALRASLGAEARRLVEREFTHAAWTDRFADLLREAAGR
jgi:glycosyltransferase involved in cell wall biosynthesis